MTIMDDPADLLAAYDEQLRTDAETPGASSVTRVGPVRLARYPGGRGFVTYRDLGRADPQGIRQLVVDVIDLCQADADIVRIDWKTRGHDNTPGLHEALLDHGFTSGDTESIMIGRAQLLAVDVELPEGVTVRQIHERPDVLAMSVMLDEVFEDSTAMDTVELVLRRLDNRDGIELWIAEAEEAIVGAGRLEPVPGTDFSGIWGGATRQQWRGRGVYRAVTAARARSAVAMGKSLIHSDSTELSRPILERSGLVKVSTTTPYTLLHGGSAG